MKLLIVKNAHSRRGQRPVDDAVWVFREAGYAVTVSTVRKSREVPRLLESEMDRADLIVLGGGDGTVHAALPALLSAKRTFGLLPLGTANNLARTLGIPQDPSEAARIVVDGHVRRIDVGDVDGRPFVNAAAIGFLVARKQTESGALRRRWGRLSYIVAAAKALARQQPFQVTCRWEQGMLSVRTRQVVIANGPYHGPHLIASETARIDDGLLHLAILEADGLADLIIGAPAFARGRQDETVRRATAPWFEITTDPSTSIMADGKIVARTPARIGLRPGALEVFVPQP